MRLLVCAYEGPDAERVVVDELSDLDDAVACCRDLVESEGYARAEVWSGVGRTLFVVVRDGSGIYESDEPDEAALLEPPGPLHEPHATRGYDPEAHRRSREHPLPPVNADGPPAEPADDGVPRLPPLPPVDPGKPGDLLGEQPGRGERWFGL